MKWTNNLRRWTMRSIHSMILGTSLLGSASIAFGQQPVANANTAKLPPQVYSHNLASELPMRMADDWRAKVTEFRLYSKTATGTWKLQETGPHTLDRFNIKVAQDGEYWYTLVTVDLQGKATPADVAAEPPSQRVVVDTTAPVIDVKSANDPDGGYCLRCTVQDANPDWGTLKAICKTADGDIPLAPVPNQRGLFRIKGDEPMKYPVHVTVMDMAGNVATKEVNVKEMIASLTPSPAPAMPGAPAGGLPAAPATLPIPASSKTDITLTSIPPNPGSGSPLPPPRMDGPPLLSRSDAPPRVDLPTKLDIPDKKNDSAVAPGLPNRVEMPSPPPLNLSQATPTAPGTEPSVPTPSQPPPLEPSTRGNVPYQLINASHASVDYRIDQVGPSGVSKVEIYMTPDKGQSWHRLGDDPDKRSPADINLPGDGVFGIRIVITNGNGFGGRPPARGESAHCEIEVDTTSPFVQLRSADVLPSTGQVEIRWNANDRNFGSTPINLFYRTRIDGAWQVIARGVKNDGAYRWAFPRDISSQFFFKVEATDQAGNASHDVTRQPVVIDMTEPRATVVGVTGTGVGTSIVRPLPTGN